MPHRRIISKIERHNYFWQDYYFVTGLKQCKKISRKDAEPQSFRKEKLCGFSASLHLCVRLFL